MIICFFDQNCDLAAEAPLTARSTVRPDSSCQYDLTTNKSTYISWNLARTLITKMVTVSRILIDFGRIEPKKKLGGKNCKILSVE